MERILSLLLLVATMFSTALHAQGDSGERQKGRLFEIVDIDDFLGHE